MYTNKNEQEVNATTSLTVGLLRYWLLWPDRIETDENSTPNAVLISWAFPRPQMQFFSLDASLMTPLLQKSRAREQ